MNRTAASHSRRVLGNPALHGLFLLSGAGALGCQMVWTRLLGVALGHEAAAMLAVVSAFFGGAAAGAWFLRDLVGRTRRPGLLYAALETALAFWALASIPLLPAAARLLQSALGTDPTPLVQWSLTFGGTLLMLLPATAAMGATLPAMVRFAGRGATPARSDGSTMAGTLYAANTAGAVLGTLLTTFVLLPRLGFRATLIAVAGLNLWSALGAWGLARQLPEASSPSSPIPPSDRADTLALEPAPPAGAAIGAVRLGATAFATGLLGIGFEVVGVRLLSQALENTIYTFALTLAVFLAGTAIGAALEPRLWPHATADQRLRRLFLALTLAVAVSLCCFHHLLPLHRFLLDPTATLSHPVLARLAPELGLASLVFGPTTLGLGATFACLARIASARSEQLSRLVALNALGAMVAPMVFGVGLLPVAGSRWALTAVMGAYLGLAMARRHLRAAAVVGGVAALVTWPLPSRFVLGDLPPDHRITEYREGITDTVAVLETPEGHRTLRVNNRFTMGGTAAAGAERRQAHLPLLLHPDPREVLMLGAGTGITLGAAQAHPNLKAWGVELVPEVAAVVPRFAPENGLADWPPRLELKIADARRFLRRTSAHYDVIIADLFHPDRDGAGWLYTQEHFRALRQRLRPGGIACQWLPLYQFQDATLQLVLRTFLDVFPETHAFLLRVSVDTPVLGVFGFTQSPGLVWPWLPTRVTSSTLRTQLQPLGWGEDFALFGLYLAGPETLRALAGVGPLNTDDHPRVLFEAPGLASKPRTPGAAQLREWVRPGRAQIRELWPSPPLAPDVAQRFAAYFQARALYVEGLLTEDAGHPPEALERFRESVRVSADFSLAYAHCLTLAVQQSRDQPARARALIEELARLHPHRPTATEVLRRWASDPAK